MENRRQTYRHPFAAEETLRVELRPPGRQAAVPCDLLDLSLGGMRVRLHDAAVSLKVGDPIVAHLLGREGTAPVELGLTLPSRVVSLEQREEGVLCGLQFLPTANPGINDSVERTLGRFLMAEQRRALRRSK